MTKKEFFESSLYGAISFQGWDTAILAERGSGLDIEIFNNELYPEESQVGISVLFHLDEWEKTPERICYDLMTINKQFNFEEVMKGLFMNRQVVFPKEYDSSITTQFRVFASDDFLNHDFFGITEAENFAKWAEEELQGIIKTVFDPYSKGLLNDDFALPLLGVIRHTERQYDVYVHSLATSKNDAVISLKKDNFHCHMKYCEYTNEGNYALIRIEEEGQEPFYVSTKNMEKE